jgi:hypothetical protein
MSTVCVRTGKSMTVKMQKKKKKAIKKKACKVSQQIHDIIRPIS